MKNCTIIMSLLLGLNILFANNVIAIQNEEDASYTYWMHIKTSDKKLTPAQDLAYLNSLIPEDETDLITTCERRVELYMKLNSPQAAIKFLDKAYDRFQSNSKKKDILYLKEEIYLKIKDYENAYKICSLLDDETGFEKIFKSPNASLTLRIHSLEQVMRIDKIKYYGYDSKKYLLLAKIISKSSSENIYFKEENISKQEKLSELKIKYCDGISDEKCRVFCDVLFEYATSDRIKALNKLYKLRKDYLANIDPMYKTVRMRTIDDFITSNIRYIDPSVGIVFINDNLEINIK